MRVESTTRYYRKIDFLDTFQYIISIVIAVTFAAGLIPGLYGEVFIFTIAAIVIQILFSLIRLRLLNVILELFLLLFAVIGFIPVLGWIFRLVGFFGAILDMATFKSSHIYKKVQVKTFKPRPSKKKPAKKTVKKFKEAEFKEK